MAWVGLSANPTPLSKAGMSMSFWKKPEPITAGEGEKECKRCEKTKPLTEFRIKATGKVNSLCNHCCDLAKALFHKHNALVGGRHYERHNELLREKREVVIAEYGGKCYCCGETVYEFLAMDHENGGGNRHRKQIGEGGGTLILWLIRHKFPPGFRVACHNCNNATKGGRVCPHKKVLK